MVPTDLMTNWFSKSFADEQLTFNTLLPSGLHSSLGSFYLYRWNCWKLLIISNNQECICKGKFIHKRDSGEWEIVSCWSQESSFNLINSRNRVLAFVFERQFVWFIFESLSFELFFYKIFSKLITKKSSRFYLSFSSLDLHSSLLTHSFWIQWWYQ